MERRLTAILAADVVGYSRLMEDDEVGTLEQLKGCSSHEFAGANASQSPSSLHRARRFRA